MIGLGSDKNGGIWLEMLNVMFSLKVINSNVKYLVFNLKKEYFSFKTTEEIWQKKLQMLPFTSTCQLDNVFCMFEDLKINQNSVQDYEVWSKS